MSLESFLPKGGLEISKFNVNVKVEAEKFSAQLKTL